MHINRPSILLLAFILALTQSTTSHPIRTSKWVKIEQFEDPNDRGIWKVFEKEGYHDQLPDPPHVKYNGNPAWPANQNNKQTEQGTPNDRYKTGTSEWGKPTVSILIPASTETPDQIHKPYSQQTGEKQEDYSEDKESSLDTLDAQRQGHYNEILQYPHTDGAINNEHKYPAPAFFSHTSSSGWTSFFAYRFPFPTLRSEAVASPQYPLPRVFTTVIVLLVMVWVAIFTIGLLELGNYLWRRRAETLGREDVQGRHSEEEDASFDETMKVPLTIVLAPSEDTRPRDVGERGYGFLESVSSDYESDSGSESDEDDYRIF
ncbi:hypothetical protein N7519_011492 [Penicillium mononematosum]|uniref:uncharacterized protein n=1 Tax=Penicillium mononematosum TaxID=268346 RepID=UPI00254672E6|nr:uncharacterized protein N7519_011492 [Penicillium mononematosum]KAJ6181031.1 hypothetical protein N7519_011492 [Penicillium mononematosum]